MIAGLQAAVASDAGLRILHLPYGAGPPGRAMAERPHCLAFDFTDSSICVDHQTAFDWVMPGSDIEQFCQPEWQDMRGSMVEFILLVLHADGDEEDELCVSPWRRTD